MPTAQVGVHAAMGGGFVVLTKGLVQGQGKEPEDAFHLQHWAAEGWRLAGLVHGNIDRGAIIVLRQGGDMAVEKALIGVAKKGSKFRVVAVETFGAKAPKKWKKLKAWSKKGWTLADQTGNLEHSAFMVMTRQKDDQEGEDRT